MVNTVMTPMPHGYGEIVGTSNGRPSQHFRTLPSRSGGPAAQRPGAGESSRRAGCHPEEGKQQSARPKTQPAGSRVLGSGMRFELLPLWSAGPALCAGSQQEDPIRHGVNGMIHRPTRMASNGHVPHRRGQIRKQGRERDNKPEECCSLSGDGHQPRTGERRGGLRRGGKASQARVARAEAQRSRRNRGGLSGSCLRRDA
jgi:hypothetical protein